MTNKHSASRRGCELDAQAHPGNDMSLAKIIPPLFLGICVTMTLISLITGVSTGRARAQEESARGTVVDNTVRRDAEGNEFFYPVVSFMLPDGSRETVQMAEGSWPPSYEVDDAVTVLYKPNRPVEARIQTLSGTLGQWTWTFVSGFLAISFLAAAMLARWVLKGVPDA